MRYFIDTEFHEHGPNLPIQLISIGIVAEDGRELYLENSEYDDIFATDWLKKNVLPHLQVDPSVTVRREEIKKRILEFIPPRPPADKMTMEERAVPDTYYVAPEFWGYFADYDWVVFCQLFGRMIDLPKGYPMFCMDLKQLSLHLGVPQDAFPKQEGQEHHALADARWNRQLFRFLMDHRTYGPR